jgi:hypothetical protein
MKKKLARVVTILAQVVATTIAFSIPSSGLAQSAFDTGSPAGRMVERDGEWYHRATSDTASRLLLAQADPVTELRKKYEALEKKHEALEKKTKELGEAYNRSREVNEEQDNKIGDLINALDIVQYPNRFLVIAFLKSDKELKKAATGFALGGSSGLPTILHNWKCQECKSKIQGNQAFLDRDTVPDHWPGTHVGAKSFASALEADEWLNHSREGKALRANSAVVVVISVTEYSHAIAAGTPTVQEIRARK